MKKEEKFTDRSNIVRKWFKYELKGTNQIIKDSPDREGSYLHSTAQSNRLNNAQSSQFDQYFIQDNAEFRTFSLFPQNKQQQFRKIHDSINITERKHPHIKLQSDDKSLKHNHLRPSSTLSKSHHNRKRQTQAKFQSDSSQICSFSSNNDPRQYKKPSCYKDKSIQTVYNKAAESHHNTTQSKRQRQGLANISLKVKNIVAKVGKMAFPQVSNAVLDDSLQDLPSESTQYIEVFRQREKQTKNIKRRVYDALNVLVAVDILGKEKRHVMCTQLTRLPGKRLSNHWQIITQKQRLLQEYKDNYLKKLNNLELLKRQYDLIVNLHTRNKQALSRQKNESRDSKNNPKKIFRFYFPLIFIIPDKDSPGQALVHIDHDEKRTQNIRKFIVEGNQYVQTDLCLLKYIKGLSKPTDYKKQSLNKKENDSSSLKIEEVYLSD